MLRKKQVTTAEIEAAAEKEWEEFDKILQLREDINHRMANSFEPETEVLDESSLAKKIMDSMRPHVSGTTGDLGRFSTEPLNGCSTESFQQYAEVLISQQNPKKASRSNPIQAMTESLMAETYRGTSRKGLFNAQKKIPKETLVMKTPILNQYKKQTAGLPLPLINLSISANNTMAAAERAGLSVQAAALSVESAVPPATQECWMEAFATAISMANK